MASHSERNSRRTEKLKELQLVFNRYIRLRDEGRPCIYCGQPCLKWGEHFPTAGHYMPISTHAHLRFDTDNVHLAGMSCNVIDDRKAYRVNLIARIGLVRVEQLESNRRFLLKLTTPEIVEKITFFRKLCRDRGWKD